MKASKKAIYLCFGMSIAACTTADRVDIGDDVTPAVIGASLVDYAGNWKGYAEAYTFNDGSDEIRLSLDEHGEGTLRLGALASLPNADPTCCP